MSSRTLLALDGNSLLHRAFHASMGSGFHAADGQPMWAVRGLLSQLVAAADRVCADAVVVGFDDPTSSSRRDRWPTYKAHRAPKPPALEVQLEAAVDALRGLGVQVVVPPGLEADDVLASAAAHAPTVGARTVVVTSDRDSFALIDEHTRMLRILNGGVDASPLLDPERLVTLTGVRPDQYLDYAALRGDASDNLPGVPGFGPKTTARLLAALGSARAAFDDAAAGRRALPGRRRRRADPDARHRRGASGLGAQLRRDDDGRHRRPRPGPRRGARLPAARRGGDPGDLRPVRPAPPGRGARPRSARPGTARRVARARLDVRAAARRDASRGWCARRRSDERSVQETLF